MITKFEILNDLPSYEGITRKFDVIDIKIRFKESSLKDLAFARKEVPIVEIVGDVIFYNSNGEKSTAFPEKRVKLWATDNTLIDVSGGPSNGRPIPAKVIDTRETVDDGLGNTIPNPTLGEEVDDWTFNPTLGEFTYLANTNNLFTQIKTLVEQFVNTMAETNRFEQ